MIPRLLAGAGALATLIAVNARVIEYEGALSSGERVFLPIAGYDPRSLIQGDYMRFQADITPERPDDRVGVAVLDADRVIRAIRPGEPAGPDQRRIRWRQAEERSVFGANEWFIEEGTAEAYSDFRYAVLHLNSDGQTLLIGVADADRELMGPAPTKWFAAPR